MTDIHNIQRLVERRKELRRVSTPEEALLWERLRNNKLGYKFRRQHSIGGYVADFYCAKARLVIELDGGVHNKSEQKLYDKDRENFLKSLNHKVLRFSNTQINNNLDLVINEITRTLS